MNIKPLGDRILIQPLTDSDKQGVTASGIVIPDTADKERPEEGKVIAVGEGRKTDSGNIISLNVPVGARVLFSKYGPQEIKVDGKEYLIAREDDILAVIE